MLEREGEAGKDEKLLEWKLVRFGLEVGELYFSKRVSRSAAELAYFLILTFFPVLICINAFIGLLHLDINASSWRPPPPSCPGRRWGFWDYIQYITGNQSPALLAAGGIMTLFSASAAFRALMNIMEDLYGRKSYAGCGIAASVAFRCSFCSPSTWPWWCSSHRRVAFPSGGAPVSPENGHPALGLAMVPLSAAVPAGVPFCPAGVPISAPEAGHGRLSLQVPFLAAVALVAATALFSWFIGLSSRYSLVYGSLASVIILLVWLYLCGNILILEMSLTACGTATKSGGSQGSGPG